MNDKQINVVYQTHIMVKKVPNWLQTDLHVRKLSNFKFHIHIVTGNSLIFTFFDPIANIMCLGKPAKHNIRIRYLGNVILILLC